jgi:hypothetical protein
MSFMPRMLSHSTSCARFPRRTGRALNCGHIRPSKIVHSEWRIADVLHRIEQGKEWKHPEHEEASVLVWRQNTLVHYRSPEPVERDALAVVSEGASFAAVCEAVAANTEEPNHTALIARLMARWLADGIVVAADNILAKRLHNQPVGAGDSG